MTSYESLDVSVRRSNRKLYNYVASQLNLDTWDELDVPLRRSTHLLYNYVKNCSGSTQTLTVIVTDESSVAISGASVVIGEASKSTGDDGKATFELEYGDYEATISAEGYATVTEELAFRSNHKNFEIELEADSGTGTVTVTCKDESENLLDGADVGLLEVGGTQPFAYGTTNSNGVTTLTLMDMETHEPTGVTDIPFGTYVLVAEYKDAQEDMYMYQNNLTVDGDENVIATLTLDE